MSTINLGTATAFNKSHRDADSEKAFALLVARWQEQNKLDVDGKLGPATQKSIFDNLLEPAIDPSELEGDHGDTATGDAPISIDADGWAQGDGVSQIPSPRHQNLVTRDASGPAPVGVVWHWTATNAGTGWSCARRIAQSPKEGERAASWHTLITRTGEILCSVPYRRGSWHAGGASAARFAFKDKKWDIAKTGGTASANSLMIGIELECVGEVRQLKDGRWSGWPFGNDGKAGPIVPEADTVMHGKKRYHNFPEAQEVAARRLLRAIVQEYGLDEKAASWGHVDIDPTRKTDPGPIWRGIILPRMLAAIFKPA
jgi:N-acetyl-anhydromuramyl-L-alanine amidase AmpD